MRITVVSFLLATALSCCNSGPRCGVMSSEESLAELNARMQTDSSSDAFCNRGTIYFRNEKFDSAITDFRTALSKDPRNAEAYLGCAMCEFRTGEHANAFRDLDSALAIDPAYAAAYYERGRLLSLLESNYPAQSGCADICKAVKLGYPVRLEDWPQCKCMNNDTVIPVQRSN